MKLLFRYMLEKKFRGELLRLIIVNNLKHPSLESKILNRKKVHS